MDTLGLYVHIPFCLRKCAYCNFVSESGRLDEIDRYIGALIDEACLYEDLLQSRCVDSVFIGGGTPSLLSAAQMEKLITGLQAVGAWVNAEITAEANPETLDEGKLSGYANIGINRLSIGLQTHENKVLQDIGRAHTWETFESAYRLAARYFYNINVDVIFGLPGQTVNSFEGTLNRLIDISPTHLSAYALKLEPGTPLAQRFDGADEDTDREMYHIAAQKLTDHGYAHYETSNFAKRGHECRHNLKYWTGKDYLGLGVAAHSYLREDSHRFGNVSKVDDYFQSIDDNRKPIGENIYLSKTDEIFEYIMLRLRLMEGIDFEDYRHRFKADFMTCFHGAVKKTISAGLIVFDESGIRPTLKGYDLQNALIGEYLKKI